MRRVDAAPVEHQGASTHLTSAELEAGLAGVLASPRDVGVIEMIVARPAVDDRVVLDEGHLDPGRGLVGDRWSGADPGTQLTLMNSRFVDLIAGSRERWPLAGDQLYVDLDLAVDNLPPGTRLGIGTAVIEVAEQPHTGCAKFAARFGADAVRFANVGRGRDLRLRGMYARVVEAGTIRAGDSIAKRPVEVAAAPSG